MAKIKNVVETRFVAQGAKSTANQTETLTRAQTRLAQSSASAGRVFSSQAKGLGGLVAAYAGAAATTYALQQAFSKLSASARSLQALEGLSTLAARTAQDASKILSSIDSITKGQIELARSTEALGLAMSSGFNRQQISGLANVAQSLGRTLGKDVSGAFDRLVRSSAKLTPTLLAELGLFPKLDTAVKNYAAALGKNAKSLNEFERRQAYVNAIIIEGERKFKSASAVMPSASEQFQKLSATIRNMTDSFTEALVIGIMPLVEFLNKHGVAAMSAFMIMGSMVASKGLDVLRSAIDSMSAAMSRAGANTENFFRKMLGADKVAKAATQAFKGLETKGFNLGEEDAAALKILKDISKERALSNEEMKIAQGLIEKNNQISSELVENARAEVVELEKKTKELKAQDAAAKQNLKNLQAEQALLKSQAELPAYKDYISNRAKIEADDAKIRESLNAETKNLISQIASAEQVDNMGTRASQNMVNTAQELAKTFRIRVGEGTQMLTLTQEEVKVAQRLLSTYRQLAKARAEGPALTSALREHKLSAAGARSIASDLVLNAAQQEEAKGRFATRTDISRAERNVDKARDVLDSLERDAEKTYRATEGITKEILNVVNTRGAQLAERLGDMFRHVGAGLTFVANGFNMLFNHLLKAFSFVSLVTAMASSIAAFIGYGEEFDAVVRNIINGIRSVFTNVERENRKKGLYSLVAGTLEEMEKLDERLRELDEFTFSSKIFGFNIEITKSKEDIIKEVSNALNTAFENLPAQDARRGNVLDDFTTFWMSDIGEASAFEHHLRTLGLTINDVVSDVGVMDTAFTSFLERRLALGLDTITNGMYDLYTSIQDVNSLLLTAEQSSLADSLLGTAGAFSVGRVGDAANMAARQLIEAMGESAQLDMRAREVLRWQLEIVQAQRGQISNSMVLQNLAELTGTSAYEMSRSFDIVTSSTSTQIVRNMNTLRDGVIEINRLSDKLFIDNLTGVEKRLNVDELNKLTFGSSQERQVVEDIILNLDRYVVSLGELQDQAVRTDHVLETFYDDFRSGAMDLASIEQGWSGVQTAIEDFEVGVRSSEDSVESMARAIDLLAGAGAGGASLSHLRNLMTQVADGTVEMAEAAIIFNKHYDDIRETVENTILALTNAARITEEFSTQMKRVEAGFGTFRDTSGGSPFAIAVDQTQALEFTMERLTNITAQHSALYDRNLQRQRDIHYFAEQNNLSAKQEQALRSATDHTIGETIKKIANGNTQLEIALRHQFQIGALTTEQLALVELTEASYKAQIGFFLENVEAAQKLTEELTKQSEEYLKQLDALQASYEIEQLKRDIQLEQAKLELDSDRLQHSLTLEELITDELESQLQTQQQINSDAETAFARQEALASAILDRENAIVDARKASLELQRQLASAAARSRDASISRELASIDTNFESRLRNALSQGLSTDATIADMTRVIQLQRELAQNQIQAAITDYELRREILEEEYRQTQATQAHEMEQLNRERTLLNERRVNVEKEISMQEEIAARRLGIQLQENIDAEDKLIREAAILEMRQQQIAEQHVLDRDILDAEIAADIHSITSANDEIQARYDLLTAQNQSNQEFLNAYAALLTEERRIREGKDAPEVLPDDIIRNFQPVMDGLTATTLAAAEARRLLGEEQVEMLRDEATQQMNLLGIERERNQLAAETLAAQRASLSDTAEEDRLRAALDATSKLADIDNQIEQIGIKTDTLIQDGMTAAANHASALERLYSETMQTIIDAAENAEGLLASIPNTVRDTVNNLVTQYRSQIEDIRRSLQNIRDENVLIQLRFEIDMNNLRRQQLQDAIQSQISNLQLQIQLTEARKDSGAIDAMEAARQVNALQLEVLKEQTRLVHQEYNNRKAALGEEFEILRAEAKMNVARIQADIAIQKGDIEINRAHLQALVEVYNSNIEATVDMENQVLKSEERLYQTFLTSLAGIVNGLIGGMEGLAGALDMGGLGLSQVSAGSVSAGSVSAQAVMAQGMEELNAASDTLISTLNESMEMQIEQQVTMVDNARERMMLEQEINAANRDARLEELDLQRQIEAERAQSRLNDAGGGSGKEDDTQKTIDGIMKTIHDAIQTLKSQLIDLAQSVLQTIGNAILATQQAALETAEFFLEFVTDITGYINDRLSSVQSELNESLEKEKSLREQLLEQTKQLTEAHKKYTDAFSFTDSNMIEASAEYVEKLWDQKETMLDLSQATRKSNALAKEEKTLLELQISQTEQLTIATEERLIAEEKLEKTQQLLDFASNMLSGSFTNLSQKLLEVGQTVAAVMQMMGMASDAGIPYASPINSIFGQFSGTVSDLGKTIKELQGARSAGGSVPSGFSGSASQYDSMLSGSGALVGGIGGAMTGFGIGSAISQMVGDSGWATTIGGTVGGALAGFFAPQITTFLTGLAPTLMSGMLGSVIGIAIPIVGSIIGALLGSLFKKTPKMSASGTLTGSEFSIDRLSASGGAKMSSAQSAGNLMSDVFSNITSTLESVGIAFEGVVKSSISAVKKNITASFTMYGKTFREGVAGGQEAAEFFMDQFFKNVKFEDLRFDDLAQGISTIRTVVQKFTQDTVKSLRTVERFAEAIEYAQNFERTLTELIGTGTSTAQIFNIIERAATANNYALAMFYRDGLQKASDFLGVTSSEYAEYVAAMQHNALAQIGLTEVMVDGEKQIVSLADAMKDIDTGAISVHNIVASISGMQEALIEAGFGRRITVETSPTITPEDTRNPGLVMFDNAIRKLFSFFRMDSPFSLAGPAPEPIPGETITYIEDIEVIEMLITTAINESLKSLTTTIRDNMQESLDILLDPAKAILPELRGITDNAKAMTKELVGQYDQILEEIDNGAQIQNGIVVTAWNNIGLSQELGYEKTVAFLRGLSEAQLEAAVNSEILSGATQEMAIILWESAKLISNQRAVASLLSSSKQMKEAISGITGVFLGIDWNGLIGIGPDFGTLAEALGGANVDGLTAALGELINDVAAGRNVVSSFTSAGRSLIDHFEDGTIKAENMASAFEHLTEVTVEYINSIQNMISQYEESLKKISEMLKSARQGVLQALEQLKETIVGSIQNTVTTSQTILKIFDDTLAGVAKSGNDLFDLQDKARESLAESTRAVLDFEEANQLSGKTVAQTTSELNDIAAQIAALTGLSPSDFGLSEFLELSHLMSQQRFLQNELNTLELLETEYADLLSKRASAQDDLAYVESTILGLGDELIDTRRQESDIIQKTQDAAVAFVKGQEELLTITEMLAEANFDLNQARIDESNAVIKMAQALAQFNENVLSLEQSFDFIIGDDFLTSIVETAVNNAKQLYSHLSESDLLPVLDEVEQSARDAAQGFIDMVDSINTSIGGSGSSSSGSIQVGTLTDRFQEFNTDLVRYLDSEGLAMFYGPGGIFEDFRNALHDTLILNGFDALTMTGGPLENFNTYLQLTGKTIDDLVSSNAVLNLEFEKIDTALGPMIVALGETENSLSVVSYGLAITGDMLDATQIGVESMNTAFGIFSASINDGQMGRSLDIVTTQIPDSISTLHENIFLLGVTLDDLNITNAMDTAVTNINTNVGLLDSTLSNINIANVVDNVGDVVTTSFEALGDSTSDSMRMFLDKFSAQIDDVSSPGSIAHYFANLDLAHVSASTVEVVDALMAVFSGDNNDKIKNVVDSMNNLNSIVTTINETDGLNPMLREFDDITQDVATEIAVLTNNAVSLRDELSGLLGSDGTLTGIKEAFRTIADDFADAWDTFRTNIDLSSPNFTVYSEIRGDPALSTSDKANLMQIATNTSIFPRIIGATYDYITPSGVRPGYAAGGLVEGPGSSTSDSIDARLSDGEFVINAQSTKAIGTKMLDFLNSFGRRGDTMLAHINPQEAELLKLLGGAGTKNPFTGFREYYPDAGAIGNIFSDQEADLLWKTYNQGMLKGNIPTHFDKKAKYEHFYANLENISNYKGTGKKYRSSGKVTDATLNKLLEWTQSMAYMGNEILESRGNKMLSGFENAFGSNTHWTKRNLLGMKLGTSIYREEQKNRMRGHQGLFDFPYGTVASNVGSNPALKQTGPSEGRTNQMLNAITGSDLPLAAASRDHIKTALDAINAQKVFTDFYMLQANNQARPSSQYLSTGGLVDRDFANSVMRDSVNAHLEPGEFVLKKPAVDKIGLADLYKLNATGEMGGDINIEVKVENNGTNQQVVNYEARRREDGKIVVDVVLEDLRTNGPISRQIRTMRR